MEENYPYDCGEINYTGRSDEQLKRALSLLSVNEYKDIKVNGYIVDGENIHFLSALKEPKNLNELHCNILPTPNSPTELFSMVRNFIDETETMDGNYNGDGSLQKGFKVFKTDREDLRYSWMYEFSIKPVLIFYGK